MGSEEQKSLHSCTVSIHILSYLSSPRESLWSWIWVDPMPQENLRYYFPSAFSLERGRVRDKKEKTILSPGHTLHCNPTLAVTNLSLTMLWIQPLHQIEVERDISFLQMEKTTKETVRKSGGKVLGRPLENWKEALGNHLRKPLCIRRTRNLPREVRLTMLSQETPHTTKALVNSCLLSRMVVCVYGKRKKITKDLFGISVKGS